jgi:hypothetical protein
MPTKYHFVSSYRLSGSREAIWGTLLDVEAWPSWWHWLKRIEKVKEPQPDDGVGATYRNHMSSPLRIGFVYDTTFMATEQHRRIDVLSTGDLLGRGRFDLADAPNGGTDLSYTWLVETTKWWMNLFAPIGRPALTWNHDRLMDDFGRGLAKTAGVTLIDNRNEIVRPGAPGFFEMPPVAPPS